MLHCIISVVMVLPGLGSKWGPDLALGRVLYSCLSTESLPLFLTMKMILSNGLNLVPSNTNEPSTCTCISMGSQIVWDSLMEPISISFVGLLGMGVTRTGITMIDTH